MKHGSPSGSAPGSAGRVAGLILGLFAAYAAVVALGLVVVRNLPRATLALDPMQQELVFEAMIGHGLAVPLGVVAAAFVRRRAGVSSRWPRAVLLSALVGGIVSADRLVGILFPPPLPSRTIFELHPARGWTHRPGSEAIFSKTLVRIDARGLRVDETGQPRSTHDRTRLLFLGDSVTMGYYHPAAAAYGRQAVERLNAARERPAFVDLNAGICGYDTRQECHWLSHEGLALDPDVVIHQFCLNDLTRRYDPAFGADQNRHAEFAWAARPTSRSGIRRALMDLGMRFKFGDDLQAAAAEAEHFQLRELLTDDPPERVQRAWRAVFGPLERIVETCRGADLPLVLVCFPILDQMYGPDVSNAPQVVLRRFADEHDVPLLDLLPVYRSTFGTGRAAAGESFKDATHPTVSGHRVAGEALADFLAGTGLLDTRSDD